MAIKNIFLPVVLVLTVISSPLYSRYDKTLTIKGLKIFSEEEIYSQLQLNRFELGIISLEDVINSIEKFYRGKNYTLVKVYVTDIRSTGKFVLFVDEGRLGKIIVHNLNNFYSLKFKYQIDIPERIYNTDVISKNINILQSNFPSSEIRMELKKPPDYEGNIIQLDRELERLKLGEIFDTAFFDRYTPLHDLHFYVKHRKSSDLSGGKQEGIGYDIDYKFSSLFIPQLYYYNANIIAARDYLESNLSVGIDPGINGLFKIPPSNTLLFPPALRFIELTGEYKISPMQNEYIGPLVRGKLYHSETSRKDLGITSYRYLSSRGTLAPEFTVLKNLNIYAGLGSEHIFIYNSKIDYRAERHINPEDDEYINSFAETRLKFDPIPIRIGNRMDKYMLLTYTNYFAGNNSSRIEILGVYDAEFSNLSVLSFKTKAVALYNSPPFYLSEDVSNQIFKGFTGKDYYSNRKLSASIEYRFSIYQDFIYAGAFFDWIIFKPEGYILSGTKQGINFGPTGRILIYDQFEFIAYFGFDRLFPDNKTDTNLKMKLRKKW